LVRSGSRAKESFAGVVEVAGVPVLAGEGVESFQSAMAQAPDVGEKSVEGTRLGGFPQGSK